MIFIHHPPLSDIEQKFSTRCRKKLHLGFINCTLRVHRITMRKKHLVNYIFFPFFSLGKSFSAFLRHSCGGFVKIGFYVSIETLWWRTQTFKETSLCIVFWHCAKKILIWKKNLFFFILFEYWATNYPSCAEQFLAGLSNRLSTCSQDLLTSSSKKCSLWSFPDLELKLFGSFSQSSGGNVKTAFQVSIVRNWGNNFWG